MTELIIGYVIMSVGWFIFGAAIGLSRAPMRDRLDIALLGVVLIALSYIIVYGVAE